MTVTAGIELPENAIADICRLHKVSELSLFGSAARGEMQSDSDFDCLVDFLLGARPKLLGVSAMTRELGTLLGRRVESCGEASVEADDPIERARRGSPDLCGAPTSG
jgi:predicted nucleotidyltransferase